MKFKASYSWKNNENSFEVLEQAKKEVFNLLKRNVMDTYKGIKDNDLISELKKNVKYQLYDTSLKYDKDAGLDPLSFDSFFKRGVSILYGEFECDGQI